MAYNDQKIDPLDFEKDIAIGFALPLANPNRGGFALNYETIDQVKTNLKNLLLTGKGERFMQPDFGVNLKRNVFEQNTLALEDDIKDDIKDAVDFWLPYVTIREIRINRTEHTVEIFIQFIINDNEFTRDSITLILEAPEGTQ